MRWPPPPTSCAPCQQSSLDRTVQPSHPTPVLQLLLTRGWSAVPRLQAPPLLLLPQPQRRVLALPLAPPLPAHRHHLHLHLTIASLPNQIATPKHPSTLPTLPPPRPPSARPPPSAPSSPAHGKLQHPAWRRPASNLLVPGLRQPAGLLQDGHGQEVAAILLLLELCLHGCVTAQEEQLVTWPGADCCSAPWGRSGASGEGDPRGQGRHHVTQSPWIQDPGAN